MKVLITVDTDVMVDFTRIHGMWKFRYDGMLFGNAVEITHCTEENDLEIMEILVENLLESIKEIREQEKLGAYKDTLRTTMEVWEPE